jgi:phosphocarrier protein HPr
MFTREVEITCKNGLHTRPASRFVKKAKEFESKITIICGETQASAKSLFKFQMLPLENGANINIQAEGADEEAAVEALVGLIAEIE